MWVRRLPYTGTKQFRCQLPRSRTLPSAPKAGPTEEMETHHQRSRMPKNRQKIKVGLKNPYWMVPKNSPVYDWLKSMGFEGSGDINDVPDYKIHFANRPKQDNVGTGTQLTSREDGQGIKERGSFTDRGSSHKFRMVFDEDDDTTLKMTEEETERKKKRKRQTRRMRKS